MKMVRASGDLRHVMNFRADTLFLIDAPTDPSTSPPRDFGKHPTRRSGEGSGLKKGAEAFRGRDAHYPAIFAALRDEMILTGKLATNSANETNIKKLKKIWLLGHS